MACDLGDRAETVTLIERAAAAFGPIDILVNNAGMGSSADPRPLAEFRDAFWDQTLELNLTAPYLLSKAALPHMRAQRWGGSSRSRRSTAAFPRRTRARTWRASTASSA